MITGWFVRLTLILAIVGVVAFEGVSIVIASVGVKDDAQSAALAAASAYQSQHTAAAAIAAAKADLNKGETLVPGSVHAAPDGTITLQVRRVANSIFLHLWKTTAKWDVVTATVSESPATQ
jgi:hypothetical protein